MNGIKLRVIPPYLGDFQRIRFSLSALAEVIALAWLILAMRFIGKYYRELDNPWRLNT